MRREERAELIGQWLFNLAAAVIIASIAIILGTAAVGLVVGWFR